MPDRCANSGLAITRRNLKVNVMQHYQNTSNTPKDQDKPPQSGLSRELRKEYCVRLLQVAMRYSDDLELSGLISAVEAQVSTMTRQRFNPGLNDASYDVFRKFWLKGGVQ